MISLQGKTNFFEKRVGEYQKVISCVSPLAVAAAAAYYLQTDCLTPIILSRPVLWPPLQKKKHLFLPSRPTSSPPSHESSPPIGTCSCGPPGERAFSKKPDGTRVMKSQSAKYANCLAPPVVFQTIFLFVIGLRTREQKSLHQKKLNVERTKLILQPCRAKPTLHVRVMFWKVFVLSGFDSVKSPI
jgi:hypothetical protein